MKRLLPALALLALPAHAAEIAVRVGDHPAHGRIVFDAPGPSHPYAVEGEGTDLRLRFAPDDALVAAATRRPPRNVASLVLEGAEARLTLRAGARARHYRLGNRIVVDVLDPTPPPAAIRDREAVPAAETPAQAASETSRPDQPPAPPLAHPPAPRGREVARPARMRNPPSPPEPRATTAAAPRSPTATDRLASRPAAAPRPPSSSSYSSDAASGLPAVSPLAAPPRAESPDPPRASPAGWPALPPEPPRAPEPTPDPAHALRAARGEDGPTLHIPAPPGTGLAVFRRGEAIIVVADTALSPDPRPVRTDPVFGATDVTTLAEATVLRLRLAAPAVLHARRDRTGWALTAAHAAPPARSILAAPDRDALLLHAPSPGRAVPIADPETGLPLLVGTLTEPGAAVPAALRIPQAEILPTTLGVAVLARGDTPSLRVGADRFALLGVSPPTPGVGADALMTRLFDLPRLDPAAAAQRLRALYASIAEAPPLGRLGLRRDAAETLLALGLGHEAQAMIRLASAEDPRAATDPRAIAVGAAAALVAGRVAEAAPLLDAGPSDEAALWSALARAARDEPAAPALAATLPLLLSYPDALRARLLPGAAEALVAGGEHAAARRALDSRPDDPSLDFARARLAEIEGRTDAALALYARLSEGRDRLQRARALRATIELRLAAGALEPAVAAAALESALFAWRGDAREAETRIRLADLRRVAGDPRAALTLLSETANLFPDRADAVRRGQEDALLTLLAREAPLPAIALAEAHSDLLPRDSRGTDALLALADRLAALDLPARAAAAARRALDRSDAAVRSTAGAALATHLLSAGDPREAIAALTATDSPDLPEALRLHRRMLHARALSAAGDADAAVAVLRDLGAPGRPALADLLAERRDWTGAATVAAEAAEDPGADFPRHAVRAAAYAALAGDAARSAAFRTRWSGRLGTGPIADAFDLLTTDPVRGLADLPRFPRELDLFRSFPRGLEAFRTAATVSR